MIACKDCEQTEQECICAFVTKFFKDNGHLMDRLAELEQMDKPQAKRCLSCFFYHCKCYHGHKKRLEKL